MSLQLIPEERLQAMESNITMLLEVKDMLTKGMMPIPDENELWTVDDIVKCGNIYYGTVLKKIKNAVEERHITTYKIGKKIAITYGTILEIGITVNPFLK